MEPPFHWVLRDAPTKAPATQIMTAIISLAESDAKEEGSIEISLAHLLEAYHTVLRQHNVVPEEDSHYYRFLLKISLEPYQNWWDKLQAEQLICIGRTSPVLRLQEEHGQLGLYHTRSASQPNANGTRLQGASLNTDQHLFPHLKPSVALQATAHRSQPVGISGPDLQASSAATMSSFETSQHTGAGLDFTRQRISQWRAAQHGPPGDAPLQQPASLAAWRPAQALEAESCEPEQSLLSSATQHLAAANVSGLSAGKHAGLSACEISWLGEDGATGRSPLWLPDGRLQGIGNTSEAHPEDTQALHAHMLASRCAFSSCSALLAHSLAHGSPELALVKCLLCYAHRHMREIACFVSVMLACDARAGYLLVCTVHS